VLELSPHVGAELHLGCSQVAIEPVVSPVEHDPKVIDARLYA